MFILFSIRGAEHFFDFEWTVLHERMLEASYFGSNEIPDATKCTEIPDATKCTEILVYPKCSLFPRTLPTVIECGGCLCV